MALAGKIEARHTLYRSAVLLLIIYSKLVQFKYISGCMFGCSKKYC